MARATDGVEERRLLKWLYAGTLVLLSIVLFATYRNFVSYSDTNDELRTVNGTLHELEAIGSALKDAETGCRGYILTHDTAYMRPFSIAQPRVERSLAWLDSMAREGQGLVRTDTLKAQCREMLKRIQEQLLAERSSPIGLQGAEPELMAGSRMLMDRIRSDLARTSAKLEQLQDRSIREERSAKPTTPAMLLTYAALAVIATALLFWRLFRALRKAEDAEAEIQRRMEQLDKEMRTREFAERSLKRVLDSSPSGIMAFRSLRDAMGRIEDFEWLLVNQEGERMVRRPAGELIGKRLLDVLPAMSSHELFQRYVEVVESGEPYIAERLSVMREGLWLGVHAVRLLDGLVVTFTDITERKRAQELLAESDKLALTGRIARTIAHEVRNPLTNLHMALEQLLEEIGPEKAAQAEPFTDILQRNMHRISKLITDLLESSKPRDLHPAACAVGPLLNDAAASVRDRISLQRMRMTVDVPSGLPEVMVDREMILVALTNLCINAVEAMDPDKGELRLSARSEPGMVRVRVEDNGKGIAPENIERLFHAFYSGRKGGMGLGLTTARNILNAHGVHIDVESTVGIGTRFTLTIPMAELPASVRTLERADKGQQEEHQ